MTSPPTSASIRVPPSREQLLYFLHEAAEIEHNLMCCYLYAAFSLKLADEVWTEAEAAVVRSWQRSIVTIALEEMTHLCLVGNLMSAIGAGPHLNRPPFPIESGPYPAGFLIRLQPFSAATIEHFTFLERPTGDDRPDGEGFVAQQTYRRHVPDGRLSPGARDYATVGELYATLAAAFDAFAAAHGEKTLFMGDPAQQVGGDLAPLPGVSVVTDLASAQRAIATIIAQGEGAGADREDSHFSRFFRIGRELEARTKENPSFSPAWPSATNPVMNTPLNPRDRVHVQNPAVARWLDVGNALYTTSLRCLLQGWATTSRAEKATWLSVSFTLMRSLNTVGHGLAARPATTENGGPNAGLTFTPLRTLAALPPGAAAAFVAARLTELVEAAGALPLVPIAGEKVGPWLDVIRIMEEQQGRLAAMAGSAPLATAPAASRAAGVGVAASLATAVPADATATAAAPATPAAPAVEVARGKSLTILFEAQRCIHSRHCVLDAPTVFKANTPGEWIYPDTLDAATLVAVAHTCPSGAIRYERHDGGPVEVAPPVNTLRIRENGPYAVHAPIALAGQEASLRLTLCRCGRSSRKPYCDGTHASAGFTASGEPKTTSAEPLAVRDGTLHVRPIKNGPLEMRGNLEICAGTGRTVARVTEARLCRCGESRTKPFCDLSHVAAGFEAEGT